VGVRRIPVILFTALTTAACHSGSRSPGASFAGAALLEPLSEAEAAHDELLRADLARADSVARRGMVDGLSAAFTDDVVYLRGGLPLVRGRVAAHAITAAESLGNSFAVRWQPVRAEASRDGKSGYSYGYTIVSTTSSGTPAIRVDRYIAFWRLLPVGWRIAAYAETYGTPPAALSLPPDAASSVLADVPMSHRGGALEAIRSADVAFSKDASKFGTGEAFGRYAASDAQIFSAPGEFISGPGAISQSFGAPTGKSSLVWHPVHGEVSDAGDLGFTVGNAVFTGEREDGAKIVNYSKYLTVWKKQRDGSWRYVVDGGSARPQ
jgi:ketosteroid isomerase-like protein